MIVTEELWDLYLSQKHSYNRIKKSEMWGLWNVWARGELPTGFWWENLKERHYLEDLVLDEKVILKCIFNYWDGEAWA